MLKVPQPELLLLAYPAPEIELLTILSLFPSSDMPAWYNVVGVPQPERLVTPALLSTLFTTLMFVGETTGSFESHTPTSLPVPVFWMILVYRVRTRVQIGTGSVTRTPYDENATGRRVVGSAVCVAADRVAHDGSAGSVADLDSILRYVEHCTLAGHDVIRDRYIHALAVGNDPAFLVVGDGVVRNRAAGTASEEERPKIDCRTVLGAVQRRLTDVVDSAIGDAGGDRVHIAVDKDPEIVRPEYLGGINRGIDIINIDANIGPWQ
jgi:hypothetical protein